MAKTIVVFNEDTIEELTDENGRPLPIETLRDIFDELCGHFPEGFFQYSLQYTEFDGEEIALCVILTGDTVGGGELEDFATDYQEILIDGGFEGYSVEKDLEDFILDYLENEDNDLFDDNDDDEEWDEEEENDFDPNEDNY